MIVKEGLRPAKKYSSHDTIPVKYYCALTLRSRGSSRSSATSARSLQQGKVLENPNHMRILKRRHSYSLAKCRAKEGCLHCLNMYIRFKLNRHYVVIETNKWTSLSLISTRPCPPPEKKISLCHIHFRLLGWKINVGKFSCRSIFRKSRQKLWCLYN